MNYGIAPDLVGEFITPECELTFVLYMPIRLAGQRNLCIPEHLRAYEPLVEMALRHEGKASDGRFIYLTVKRLFVQPGCVGSRLGWHTDGFGTSDVNYIWADTDPTEFCIQPFDLCDDHEISMRQMEEQASPENIVTYEACDVLRIDARHVHRCPMNPREGYRTFARVSFSDDRYNMIGNAHNYGLDYNWVMHPRGGQRNDVSIRAQGIEARQGGDGTAPSSDESPTPQGDAPQSTQEEPTHDQ